MTLKERLKVIDVRNLRKKYKKADEESLKGVNLSIYENEFFGLLGPNAAGKTTMISLMCGLLKITKGDIEILGENIKNNQRKISKQIGLIPQELALFPTLTVKENLHFFGKMYGIFGKELNIKVEECIETVKLNTHINKQISKCSGGIKRRTNLMVGLIHNPPIVFLDEPTLGVDAQSRNLIFEYLENLNKNGKTIIYTTHYMDEVEKLCSRLVIIDNGEIIKEGTPKSLLEEMPDCLDLGQVFLKLTGKALRD